MIDRNFCGRGYSISLPPCGGGWVGGILSRCHRPGLKAFQRPPTPALPRKGEEGRKSPSEGAPGRMLTASGTAPRARTPTSTPIWVRRRTVPGIEDSIPAPMNAVTHVARVREYIKHDPEPPGGRRPGRGRANVQPHEERQPPAQPHPTLVDQDPAILILQPDRFRGHVGQEVRDAGPDRGSHPGPQRVVQQ